MTTYSDLSTMRMREVMGNFCSGITIITAMTSEGPTGFTCQSFTSLSLDPPLVTFNPQLTSKTWPRIREVGTFCVNILAKDTEHYSGAFARSGTDKFQGVNYTTSELGHPILEGCLGWIECTLYAEHDGGDHTIVVGKVESMHARTDCDPLVFFRGKYATLKELAKVS